MGLLVGDSDGEKDGATDGLKVGLLVGKLVGANDGGNVGKLVGAGVGAGDGLLVGVLDIDGIEIADIGANAYLEWLDLNELHLNAEIECNEATDDDNANYCAQVQIQSKKNNDFDERVTAALRSYYQHNSLVFTVDNGDSLVIECKDCDEEPPNYVLYGLASVVGLIYLVAIFALLFNMGKFPKLPGFHYVDNGNWVALMTIGLQFWHVHIHFVYLL